ncbi:MAG: class I SAM-dependent methyltransferase [Saprospiraceae bacterium]|jgi:SAM-dependent methyltransferase|nr:class I SAM-dependent methyltransferase [Saprospiraceae bacterium]MBP9210911.1 class I SAM-dependent methyltransferase [Saprospiraceae bacterium]
MTVRYFLLLVVLSLLTCRERGTQALHPAQMSDSLDIEEQSGEPDRDMHDRTVWQKPYEVIHRLGPLEYLTVADIGAGSGYFSFRFIHEAARVIAIDIDPDLIRLMDQEKQFYRPDLRRKFEARLAEAADPKLLDGEVDVVFIANTYPYLDNRADYLRNLIPKFREGGRIMIVDFKKEPTPIGPSQSNRLAQYEVELELINAGYRLLVSDGQMLEYQYILIATPSGKE